MSNRVTNIFPAAKASSKPSVRRAEPAATDEGSFEQTLEKAKPKPRAEPKPATRAERSRRTNKSNPQTASAESTDARAPHEKSNDKSPIVETTAAPENVSEEAPQREDAASDAKSLVTDDKSAPAAVTVQNVPVVNVTELHAATGDTESAITTEGKPGPVAESDGWKATRHVASPLQASVRAADDATAAHDESGASAESDAAAVSGHVLSTDNTDVLAPAAAALEISEDDLLVDSRARFAPPTAAAAPAQKALPLPSLDAPIDAAESNVNGVAAATDVSTNGETAGGDPDPEAFARQFTLQQDAVASPSESTTTVAETDGLDSFAAAVGNAAPTDPARVQAPAFRTVALPAEQVFADANHPQIITNIRHELLPNGGTMQIRLDPPELAALQIMVQMRDGVVTASFQTSNDEATRMLSHSLHQLKQSLESQGITVDRMNVQQTPRSDSDLQSRDDSQQQRQHSFSEQHSARQEQQRREMMQRLWQKLAGTDDFVDLVA